MILQHVKPTSGIGPAEWLITIGGAVFILALVVSAIFIPEIRWLHVFQASIYVFTILLSLRHSRWGHFTGISAAGFWNYLALFASTLVPDLIDNPTSPDLLIQGAAWLANLAVIVGCVWAYSRLPNRSAADFFRFIAAFVLATGFLALAIAVFAPAYLDVFRRVIHPHWPWLGGETIQ